MILYLFTLASLLTGSIAEPKAIGNYYFSLSDVKVNGIKEAKEYCMVSPETKIASDISEVDWKHLISMIPPESGNKLKFNFKVFK